MNKDEFEGAARHFGGKLEKGVGDLVESRPLQVDGIVDKVAGGAQHIYGRARSIVEDAVDGAPELLHEGSDRLRHVSERANEGVRQTPLIWIAAAALGSYALAWLIHGRQR